MSHTPTVYLGADHGGFELKERLKSWLIDQGYEVADCGAHDLEPNDDYPEFAFTVGESVATAAHQPQPAKGILLCRSGGGMIIAANKVAGVRAVAVASEAEVEHAVEHNNANVIAIGADSLQRTVGDAQTWPQVQHLVQLFLDREFTGEERHQRRVAQITQYETSTA